MWLNIAKFVYNNNINSIINKTFFELMFDVEIKLKNVLQKIFRKNISTARNWTNILTKTKIVFQQKWIQLTKRAQKNYDKKHVDIKFKSGNMMYLNVKNIEFIRPFKKFDYKYYKFYQVLKLIKKIFYRFDFLGTLNKIHDVFHVFLLKSIQDNDPLPIIWMKKNEKWKIEEIVNSRKKYEKRNYLMKWLKY